MRQSSTVKMEAIDLSEDLAHAYYNTRCHTQKTTNVLEGLFQLL